MFSRKLRDLVICIKNEIVFPVLTMVSCLRIVLLGDLP